MCGIWPLNPYFFSADDFLPSAVTDQSLDIINDNQNGTIENILELPIEFDPNLLETDFNLKDSETVEVITIGNIPILDTSLKSQIKKTQNSVIKGYDTPSCATQINDTQSSEISNNKTPSKNIQGQYNQIM